MKKTVLICLVKSDSQDKAHSAGLLYYTYKRCQHLWNELIHDLVLEGSIHVGTIFPVHLGTNNIALVGDTGFEPVTSTV